MKRILSSVVVSLLAFVGAGAVADEIFWTKLQPRFTYRDLNHGCSGPSRDVYVVARVSQGKIVRAELRDGADYFMQRAVLQPSEFAAIEIEKDVIGDYWVKKFPMTPRLLVWTFHNMDPGAIAPCRPTKPLATLDPMNATFEFKPKSGSEFVSPQVRFNGTMQGGEPFEITLGFSQFVIGT